MIPTVHACLCILHPLNINHLSFIDWFNPFYGDNEACYTKSIPDMEHLMLDELRWNVGLFSVSYYLYNSSCLSIRDLGVKKTIFNQTDLNCVFDCAKKKANLNVVPISYVLNIIVIYSFLY